MSTRRTAVLECRGLTKVFRDFWLRPRVTAVSGLDLEIAKGEVLGLLGPNGSGKSTTIKALLGLLRPTSGEVRLFGRPPADVSVKRRIGFLPEESHLYPFLSAAETLDFFGRLFRLGRKDRSTRAGELLALVDLEGVERRRVGEFSKGMKRRLGLAQALINDPELLILDEPTSGLDPIGTRRVKDLVLTLKARGVSVLLSSHLLADVEDLCDRIVVLHGGSMRASGAVESLLAVGSRVVIECETLRQATLDKIRSLVRAEEGKELLRVEVPRQKLEAFFLATVEGSRAPDGAASMRMPEFLGKAASQARG